MPFINAFKHKNVRHCVSRAHFMMNVVKNLMINDIRRNKKYISPLLTSYFFADNYFAIIYKRMYRLK